MLERQYKQAPLSEYFKSVDYDGVAQRYTEAEKMPAEEENEEAADDESDSSSAPPSSPRARRKLLVKKPVPVTDDSATGKPSPSLRLLF